MKLKEELKKYKVSPKLNKNLEVNKVSMFPS